MSDARTTALACAGLLWTVTVTPGAQMPSPREATMTNTLSPEEKAGGWRLLFDGRTLAGWRGYRAQAPPGGWQAVDGTLRRAGPGGDLITVDQFRDFELRLEWRIGEGGNSGIFFRVSEQGDYVWSTGPEMQVLDNTRHKDGQDPLTSAGSNFALHAPSRDVTRPVGAWNAARLVARGPHVEHWLNGEKIVEYELWSADWEGLVQASKFAKLSGYGRSTIGHIALQDHGDAVWYRNIKIRPL